MSTVSAISTASDIQANYIKLLVAQLKYQDPMEPLDNNQMASQLAQLSQLQQLETMNRSFGKVLTSIERTYADSLLGKDVSFATKTDEGTNETQHGIVEQVYNSTNGEILLEVGDYTIKLENVLSVKQ